MKNNSILSDFRTHYHKQICGNIFARNPKSKNNPFNFADSNNASSVAIAERVVKLIGHPICKSLPKGQTAGDLFTKLTKDFLQSAFKLLQHIRPGEWGFSAAQGANKIGMFEQYRHLLELEKLVGQNKELRSALGSDYLVTPDIVISRKPLTDKVINSEKTVLKENDILAEYTPLRAKNNKHEILHASISCKWTIRSDRSQNTRTEALNLIRNRKGKTPQVMAATMEPLPTRLNSIALGTGDIDCTYHAALPELLQAVTDCGNIDQLDALKILIDGRRIRDISDLPFDLLI